MTKAQLEILGQVRSDRFYKDVQVDQVRAIFTRMFQQKLGQSFLYFNLKEVLDGSFPPNYVEEFTELCNLALREINRPLILEGEFLKGFYA